MKIAVLGGGLTGLTAAYKLSKKGHEVVVFEKNAYLGGLAAGFQEDHWEWPLEKAYHHLFSSDNDILDFAKEVEFDDIYFSTPDTDSLYKQDNNYRIIPVDSPQDFLRFPLLSVTTKLRASVFLALLKFGPFLKLYESMSAKDFIVKYMGEEMWIVFFEQLFTKKFGPYAEEVLASFLWARINKRTKDLGYIKGGFQAFTEHIADKCREKGVDIRMGESVGAIKKSKDGFKISHDQFDKIVSTLPTPVFTKVAKDIVPKDYAHNLNKLDYLHARVLVIETDKPILRETYWLNICTKDIPMMFVGQHTNFVSSKHYGGKHVAYVGYYLEKDDELMSMSQSKLLKHILPHLQKLDDNDFEVLQTYDFKGPFAQPIFNKKFLEHKPDFETPTPGLYIANLDMTYPYDRGTNFAISLGKAVAEKVR